MHIGNAANGLSCYEGATLLPSRMMCNRDLVWVLSNYLNSRQLSRPAPHQHCWRTMWINSLRQHRRQGAERSAFAVEAIRVGVGLELAEVLDFKVEHGLHVVRKRVHQHERQHRRIRVHASKSTGSRLHRHIVDESTCADEKLLGTRLQRGRRRLCCAEPKWLILSSPRQVTTAVGGCWRAGRKRPPIIRIHQGSRDYHGPFADSDRVRVLGPPLCSPPSRQNASANLNSLKQPNGAPKLGTVDVRFISQDLGSPGPTSAAWSGRPRRCPNSPKVLAPNRTRRCAHGHCAAALEIERAGSRRLLKRRPGLLHIRVNSKESGRASFQRLDPL